MPEYQRNHEMDRDIHEALHQCHLWMAPDDLTGSLIGCINLNLGLFRLFCLLIPTQFITLCSQYTYLQTSF